MATLVSELGKIDLLNIIEFHYKNEEDTQQPHFGFIAQEIEANYPNLVVRDSDNNLRVKYIELINSKSVFI